MSVHAIFGGLAGLLAVAATVPYIISILRGETRPNRATFLIWSVVDIVLISSYISSGARTTVWTLLVYTVAQLVVVVLSIKHGMGGLGKLDLACLLGAFIGICLWIATNNAQTALYLSIFCEILGFLPTIKKAYAHPETESKISWIIALFASSCNLLAINSLKPAIIAYPIYNVTFVGIVAILLITRQKSQKPTLASDLPR